MKITNVDDVQIGHFITFRSTYNGELTRKFYEILWSGKSGFQCRTLKGGNSWGDAGYDTVIDNIFDCKDDEVFSSLDDLMTYYPEEFI